MLVDDGRVAIPVTGRALPDRPQGTYAVHAPTPRLVVQDFSQRRALVRCQRRALAHQLMSELYLLPAAPSR